MTYRIVISILLILGIVGAGVLLEYDEPSTTQPKAASAPAPAADDSAMQSLRIP